MSNDGAMVELQDGRRYLVAGPDRYRTALWDVAESVTVCDPGRPAPVLLVAGRDRVRVGRL